MLQRLVLSLLPNITQELCHYPIRVYILIYPVEFTYLDTFKIYAIAIIAVNLFFKTINTTIFLPHVLPVKKITISNCMVSVRLRRQLYGLSVATHEHRYYNNKNAPENWFLPVSRSESNCFIIIFSAPDSKIFCLINEFLPKVRMSN